MIFYIADCHFGDAKVINFSSRPFRTLKEMDQTMLDRWQEKVNPEDDVYILGDLVCRSNQPEYYLKQLPGRLHLILGNHDQAIVRQLHLQKYFEEIHNYQVIHDGSHRIVLFHYPILEWDGYYYGTWHIYGHIHNHPSKTQKRVGVLGKALNAGVDITNFSPMTFDELVAVNGKEDCRGPVNPVAL